MRALRAYSRELVALRLRDVERDAKAYGVGRAL